MPENKGLNYFDAIFYINLEHRNDRNNALLKELERLQVSNKKIHRINALFDPLNGHKGCALSHAKAIQYAIRQKLKNVLILEDDFFSTHSPLEFEEIISHFVETTKNNWDVFLLGGRVKRFEKTDNPFLFRALSSSGAHAYAVNEHYFQTLMTLFLYSYEQIKNDTFFLDSEPKAIDQLWDCLMEQDAWYFIKMIGEQRADYSDIIMSWRAHKPYQDIS